MKFSLVNRATDYAIHGISNI